MFCKKCGTKNNEDSTFCKECGESLTMLSDTPKGTKHEAKDTKKSKRKPKRLIVRISMAVAIIAVIATGVLVYMGLPNNEYSTSRVIAQQGDWIYYRYDFADMANRSHTDLYRMRTDGTSKTKIRSMSNVADVDSVKDFRILGDWIYYMSRKDNNYNIYKIHTDGTTETKINNTSDIRDSADISVVGDTIYYIGLDDGSSTGTYKTTAGIYKINTDGTGKTKVGSMTDYQHKFNLNVVGNWIYYVDGDGSKSDYVSGLGDYVYLFIYRINIDGTGLTKIDSYYNTGSSSGPGTPPSIHIVGDWIYQLSEYNISKTRTDGTGKTIIGNTSNITNDADFSVVGDWIYYYASKSDNSINGIYKVRTDGTDNTKIVDPASVEMGVVSGDWLYYDHLDMSKNSKGYYDIYNGTFIYKVRTDGTENQQVK